MHVRKPICAYRCNNCQRVVGDFQIRNGVCPYCGHFYFRGCAPTKFESFVIIVNFYKLLRREQWKKLIKRLRFW